MKTLDLSALIEETQKQQQLQLQDFEKYINASTELKNNANKSDDEQKNFVAQVLKDFASGTISTAVIDENKNLALLWSILLKNKSYIEKLGAVAILESGTTDQRLAALVKYMESHLSADRETK